MCYTTGMDAFFHHSRLPRFRSPQGAAPCGGRVAVAAACGGALQGAQVFLRLWQDGVGERLLPMQERDGLLRAEVALPDTPCLIWYFFVIHTADGHTFYYGGSSGPGALYKHEPPAWRITVYRGAFTTPAWFCEGIAYQIFPDRFCRSSWEAMYERAGAHRARGRRVRLHDRWSEEPVYRPAPGEADYVPDDYFGGDLNGIRQKLPYLQSLGVTCLYLNPVFEAASNHRYNTADYRAIDPLLGTEEEFAALCAEARALGMRVMLDGVFSHTGSDSRYFDRFGRYEDVGAFESQASPYYPWYSFRRWPDEYACWWNFPTLPNVQEMTPSYAAFIAGEDGVLAHWAARGATSWRLDVADELPDAFIRLLRSRVKALDPEGVLLGEVWEDCSDKQGPEGRRGYVNGDELDSAMNYPFANAVLDFLLERCDAPALAGRLMAQREWYPAPFYRACLNLLSSHDIVRAITALSGAPGRDELTRAQQAAYTPAPEQARLGRERFMLATAIQMFCPGVPCVYYGDEAGVTGMADPFNRRTYPWGGEDRAVQARVAALMRLRRDLAALRAGRCRMGALSPAVFGVVRYTDGGELALLLVNRGDAPCTAQPAQELFAEGPDADAPMPLDGPCTDEEGRACAPLAAAPLTVPPHAALIRIRRA